MTTIYIPFETTRSTEQQLATALNDTAITDPNWCGASFEIIRDDFMWIETDDEYAGTALLNEVVRPALH